MRRHGKIKGRTHFKYTHFKYTSNTHTHTHFKHTQTTHFKHTHTHTSNTHNLRTSNTHTHTHFKHTQSTHFKHTHPHTLQTHTPTHTSNTHNPRTSNTPHPPPPPLQTYTTHTGSFDRFLNMQILMIICMQFALCISCTAASQWWKTHQGVLRPYLALDVYVEGNYKGVVGVIITFLTFWLLFSYLVPISLFVTMEIVKFWYVDVGVGVGAGVWGCGCGSSFGMRAWVCGCVFAFERRGGVRCFVGVGVGMWGGGKGYVSGVCGVACVAMVCLCVVLWWRAGAACGVAYITHALRIHYTYRTHTGHLYLCIAMHTPVLYPTQAGVCICQQ